MSLAKLRDQMMEHFNKSELRDICFDLSINHENIAGDTLNDMARELVLYCHRLRRIEELVKYCEKLRPDASWHLIQADGLVDTQHLLENNSPHDDKVSRDSIETYVQKWIDYCVTWSQSEDMKDALERNWLDIEKTINLLYFRTGLPLSLQDKVAASQLVRIIEAIHPHIFGYDFNSEQVKLLIFGYESARSLNDLRNAGKCAFSIANYYTVKTNETSLAERWVYRLEDLIPQVVTEEKYIPYLKGYIFEMLGHISLRNSNFIEAQKRYNMAQTKYEEIGSQEAQEAVNRVHAVLIALYREQANTYVKGENFTEAEILYIKARDMLVKMSEYDEDEYNDLINSMASMYLSQGELFATKRRFPEAEHSYNKAIYYFEESQDDRGKAMVLTNLGMLYEKLRQYEKAEEYFVKAHNTQWQDKSLLCFICFRLGSLYVDWGFPDPQNSLIEKVKGYASRMLLSEGYAEAALKPLTKALDLALEYGRDDLLHPIHHNIAVAYWRLRKYADAFQYATSALRHAEDNHDFSAAELSRKLIKSIERSRRGGLPF